MLIEKIWNGKGKLYDENENLYFEGEYLDGQIQGKFKKYYTQDTQMEIEGECIN
jgi:antitoxin component YwqK of YwqJK toxin-antitoxin module